jgi:hypothetical protein
MHCIRQLAMIYGTDPVQLSRHHYWQRGSLLPFQDCGKINCNRLQRITRGKPQNLRDHELTVLVQESRAQSAVVFGHGP